MHDHSDIKTEVFLSRQQWARQMMREIIASEILGMINKAGFPAYVNLEMIKIY
jgi:hypothetical protein